MSHLKECYNMLRDGIGSVDPKQVNERKLLMYYDITNLKDKASYQPN